MARHVDASRAIDLLIPYKTADRPNAFEQGINRGIKLACWILSDNRILPKIDGVYLNKEKYEKLIGYEDKQTAKKPYDKGHSDWHIVCCPSCDRVFWNSGNWMHYEPKFCEKCGQKIDWTDYRSYLNG